MMGVPLDRIRGADGVVAPKGLVGSLRAIGLLHPVLLYHPNPRHPERADYVVIAGRKRLAAARELGWETINAYVVDDYDPTIPIHENLHRSPSPALEARCIGRWIAVEGLSQREVAKTLGISQAQVSQRLALLSLVPEALGMLERGELRPTIARALAKLPPEDQKALLAGESHPTLAQVEAHRRQRKLEALADLPLPPPLGPQPLPGRPQRRPGYCPGCGSAGLDLQECADGEGILNYDCYCPTCTWSGDISPDEAAPHIDIARKMKEN